MSRFLSTRYGATLVTLVAVCISSARALAGQTRPDTLYLDDLQRASERADRRSVQQELLAQQSRLRLETVRSERLPAFSAIGTSQYLSDVANIGAVLPGVTIPGPHHDQYDAYLSAREPLFDATRRARVAVEQAQTLESQARVRTAIWQQRGAVSEAFFGVVLRDAQLRTLDVAVADLDARLRVAAIRVRAGAALPSEELLLQAERGRRLQSRDELSIERDAAREVLASLTGREIPSTAALAVRTAAATSLATRLPDTVRARPEFAQFDRSRALLDARRAALIAQDRPRLSAFARSGYGRPGLNALGRSFDAYWSAGVQAEWTPWNWGRTRRDLEVQALQESVLRSDETTFRENLSRGAITEHARLKSLERSLVADDSIVILRERILRETRLRFDAGEVNAADYVARLTEQLNAQLDRAVRRVRVDESRARYLTTLGLEVR